MQSTVTFIGYKKESLFPILEYLADKSKKVLRDKLIIQYIYLTRYVVGRVKVALPPTFSYEDIDDAVTLASRR